MHADPGSRPMPIDTRLLELGFIKEAFGGWILNDIVSLRAAKGR